MGCCIIGRSLFSIVTDDVPGMAGKTPAGEDMCRVEVILSITQASQTSPIVALINNKITSW
jgi:hypothetical protein